MRSLLLKVMPDYECWPLWREDMVGNVDPASLAITPALRDRLFRWAQTFDNTLIRDDPAASGFGSPESEGAFDAEGRALALDLQRELGDSTKVRYWRDPT